MRSMGRIVLIWKGDIFVREFEKKVGEVWRFFKVKDFNNKKENL